MYNLHPVVLFKDTAWDVTLTSLVYNLTTCWLNEFNPILVLMKSIFAIMLPVVLGRLIAVPFGPFIVKPLTYNTPNLLWLLH